MSQLEVIANAIEACPTLTLAGVYIHDNFNEPDLYKKLPPQRDRPYEVLRMILACLPTVDLDTWTVGELEAMLSDATDNGLAPIDVEPFRHNGHSISRGRVHYLDPIGHLSLKGHIQLSAKDVTSLPAGSLERELDIARRITVTLAPRREYVDVLLAEGAETVFPIGLDAN